MISTTFIIWLGFFFSLGLLLFIARKNVWLGLVISSYVLGLFSLSFEQLWEQSILTVTEPSIVLLAIAVGLIPMIGGVMEQGGLMDDLVRNLRLKRKYFMPLTSAFVGLLPMPGGALLSAPLVDRSGEGVSNEIKTAINIWFRHVFLLIYPLGVLLATTRMAQLNLYVAAAYLIPGFILMVVLGNIFLLKGIDGNNNNSGTVASKKLIVPVSILLIAPIIHSISMLIFRNLLEEIPLVIGVCVSLVMAVSFSTVQWNQIGRIARRMKPWNFGLIIIGMFLFLNIFQASETSRVIAQANFSKDFLLVGVGALLGFATGRVMVPISILLPIYFAQFGQDSMNPFVFAIMFFSVYQGYVISPVHPCVSVSLQYFKTNLKDFYKLLLFSAGVGIAAAWGIALILL